MKLIAFKKIASQKINTINYLNLSSLNYPSYKKVEKRIKATLNIKDNLILLGRARTGIYLLVKYFLKNNSNKKVLVSPFTIPAIIKLIRLGGGKVIFTDNYKNSTFIDYEKLNLLIKKEKPALLILTHYNLVEKNYFKICKLCKKNKVKIIEDSAISPIGGISEKKLINSQTDASIFSFSSFKLINYFYGGAIRCKNNNIYYNILDEINKWKKFSIIDYFPQVIKTLLYQIITSNLFYNFFTFMYLKKKISNNLYKNDKIYFSKKNINLDRTYFLRVSNGFLNEIFHKLINLKKEINHRRAISIIYYRYLKSVSTPYEINLKQIKNSSCFNYLVNVKNSEYVRKILFKNGYSVGKTFYDNCKKIKEFKNINGSTKNIDKLIKDLLILPTHLDISKGYAKNLALNLNKIIQSHEYKRLK